jgi:predicted amidophosphoribosyltransferase
MGQIDLRDGVADGCMSAQVSNCSDCGRPVNTKRSRCIYCGTAIEKPHVFQ